ncbi:MAG TPA: SH3 domain-containing protein, partial [Gammaproteobacteria bacterium]|nr:SH3 domain-containing protein [Gammaproteobacteria bacterium]
TTENTAIDISPSSDSSQTSALFRAALVTQPNAHVLSRPDASGTVIALLDPNTPIKIIGSKGNWKMIQSPDGLDVWVWGKFIDERGAAAIINRNRVRIRSRPSTTGESDVLGVLDSGTKVTVVSRKGDWARLRIFGAVSGWIDSAQVMTLPTVSDDWRARWASAQALSTR